MTRQEAIESLKRDIHNATVSHHQTEQYEIAIEALEEQKTGYWIRAEHTTRHICSNCGKLNLSRFKPYCYECGSKNETIEYKPNYMDITYPACTCISCKKVVTDGRIFRLKERPEKGLCFDCY